MAWGDGIQQRRSDNGSGPKRGVNDPKWQSTAAAPGFRPVSRTFRNIRPVVSLGAGGSVNEQLFYDSRVFTSAHDYYDVWKPAVGISLPSQTWLVGVNVFTYYAAGTMQMNYVYPPVSDSYNNSVTWTLTAVDAGDVEHVLQSCAFSGNLSKTISTGPYGTKYVSAASASGTGLTTEVPWQGIPVKFWIHGSTQDSSSNHVPEFGHAGHSWYYLE